MQGERESSTLGRRALVTAGVLALFVVGRQVPLPGIDLGAFPARSSLALASLVALGLTPWLVGWLSIEVVSLLPWPLRGWRRGGWEGRRKLERASMVAGLAFALIQARGIASLLESWTGSGGMPLVPNPGWQFWLPCGLTLTAASASLYWLATVVSRWGIGNGFSVLLLTELALQLWREITTANPGELPMFRLASDRIFLPGLAALTLAVALVVYLRSIERVGGGPAANLGTEPDAATATEEAVVEEGLAPAPVRWGVAFPQSLIAVPLAGLALQLLCGRGNWGGLLGGVFGNRFASWGVWPWIVCQTLLVALLAWLSYRLFSGAKRLATELPAAAEGGADLATALGRRFGLSTLLLLAGSAGLAAWSVSFPGPWATLLDIIRLGLLIAVPWDLASQWSFTRRHGAVATLCSLNNVHLAPRIVAHLEAAGLPATLQGFRHRALFFSYLPLVQIGVLVPEQRLEEARRRLAELDLAVV